MDSACNDPAHDAPGNGMGHLAALSRRIERLPLLTDRRLLAYALAIGLSLLTWWVRWSLDEVFPSGFQFVAFFPAVMLSSFLFGRGPGIVAAVLCGLLAWYWFIPPFRSFVFNGAVAVGLAMYAFSIAVDIAVITWMQTANRRVAFERERNAMLLERTELLFSELQHRVSNNLQMVGAVLNLQRRQVSDPAALKALGEASTKLQMIGRIQRQLYDTKGEQVALDVFLSELVDDVVAAGGKPGVHCTVDAEPGISLSPDAAIPVALIMAEAVANAIEHGFAGEAPGRLAVAIVRRGAMIDLSVRDDGAGLPPGFDPATTTSLGLKIARTLAAQLDARFTVEPADPGTTTRLLLPADRTLLRA